MKKILSMVLVATAAENWDSYDTVFIGYPIWWGIAAWPVDGFVEANDFTGKDVYLFCSHGTGGLAGSVEIITETVPDAVLSENIFDCYEEDASSSEELVKAWVRELGFAPVTETDPHNGARQIAVQFDGGTLVCEINDSPAADSLYEQLPLTVEVEDYSTNEKIFYPPEALDTQDTPLACSGAGTLAYYEPWGDIVFFYGDYNENPSLFELGQIVAGNELVSEMSGTITIEDFEL